METKHYVILFHIHISGIDMHTITFSLKLQKHLLRTFTHSHNYTFTLLNNLHRRHTSVY